MKGNYSNSNPNNDGPVSFFESYLDGYQDFDKITLVSELVVSYSKQRSLSSQQYQVLKDLRRDIIRHGMERWAFICRKLKDIGITKRNIQEKVDEFFRTWHAKLKSGTTFYPVNLWNLLSPQQKRQMVPIIRRDFPDVPDALIAKALESDRDVMFELKDFQTNYKDMFSKAHAALSIEHTLETLKAPLCPFYEYFWIPEKVQEDMIDTVPTAKRVLKMAQRTIKACPSLKTRVSRVLVKVLNGPFSKKAPGEVSRLFLRMNTNGELVKNLSNQMQRASNFSSVLQQAKNVAFVPGMQNTVDRHLSARLNAEAKKPLPVRVQRALEATPYVRDLSLLWNPLWESLRLERVVTKEDFLDALRKVDLLTPGPLRAFQKAILDIAFAKGNSDLSFLERARALRIAFKKSGVNVPIAVKIVRANRMNSKVLFNHKAIGNRIQRLALSNLPVNQNVKNRSLLRRVMARPDRWNSVLRNANANTLRAIHDLETSTKNTRNKVMGSLKKLSNQGIAMKPFSLVAKELLRRRVLGFSRETLNQEAVRARYTGYLLGRVDPESAFQKWASYRESFVRTGGQDVKSLFMGSYVVSKLCFMILLELAAPLLDVQGVDDTSPMKILSYLKHFRKVLFATKSSRKDPWSLLDIRAEKDFQTIMEYDLPEPRYGSGVHLGMFQYVVTKEASCLDQALLKFLKTPRNTLYCRPGTGGVNNYRHFSIKGRKCDFDDKIEGCSYEMFDVYTTSMLFRARQYKNYLEKVTGVPKKGALERFWALIERVSTSEVAKRARNPKNPKN